jgi:hypothetical protein
MVAQTGSPYAVGQDVGLGALIVIDTLVCSITHWKAMKKSSNLVWD